VIEVNRKILSTVIALAFIMIFATFAPVFAKNQHLPPGATWGAYYSGGNAVVDLPATVQENWPYPESTATKMYIGVYIDEMPGYEGVRFFIMFWETMPGATEPSWQPWVEFTTNPNTANFLRTFWGGTATEFNLAAAVFYLEALGVPSDIAVEIAPLYTTDNVFVVSDDVLQVERHGNSIFAHVAAQDKQIKVPMTISETWTLPELSVKLDKYGGSVHTPVTLYMTGWPGACDGTLTEDLTGFNANGAFTCLDWNLNAAPMSEGWITMHGIQTFYPYILP
jgi:hypothetical protein